MKSLPRSTRIGLLVIALASMIPLAEAENNPWPPLLALLCAGVGEAVRSSRRPRRVPIVAMVLLTIACMCYLAYETIYSAEPVPAILALGHFLVFLACCKFLEAMQARDMGVVLVISLLLLVIGGLTSGSVVFAAVLALDLTYGMYWLIRFHQIREEGSVAARGPLGAIEPTPTHPRLRVAGVAIVISTLLLVSALATFVFTPRGLSRQMFGRLRSPIAASVTGYTDQIELRSGGLRESDAMVMRVRVTREALPIGGEDQPLYLRGRTFDCYARGRWLTRTFASIWRFDPSPLDEPLRLSAAFRSLAPAELLTQSIWLEPNKGPSLFCLYPPLAVSAGDGNAIDQNCDDYSLSLRGYRRQAVHYTVISPAAVTPRVARTLSAEYAIRADENSRLRPDERPPISGAGQHVARTSSPASDIPAAVGRIALELVSTIGNPADPALHRAMAERFEGYLKSGGFEYTLDPVTDYRGGDRLEQFLTTVRRGHCEFFASAMTALCQSVNIPARLVSGYLGTEYIDVGGFYLVRQKDAHAWVEVFLPEIGWTTFDPSPSGPSRHSGDREGLVARMAGIAEYLQFEWVTFVVSFDAEYRREIFSAFEHWFLRIDESRSGLAYAYDVLVAFFRGPAELQPRQRLLYWCVLALVLLMVALILRLFWKLALMAREFVPRQKDAGIGPRHPDARFYDRMLLLLRRRGFVKPRSATPAEFAESVADADPRLADIIPCTAWFYESQYGRCALDPQQRAAVRGFLEYLREGPPIRIRPDSRMHADTDDSEGENGNPNPHQRRNL